MALFMDGMDYYNTQAAFQSRWDVASAPSSWSGIGSGVFAYGRYTVCGSGVIYKTFADIPGVGSGANWPTIYCCFHLQPDASLGADTNHVVALLDGATNQINFRVTNTGVWKVYRNATLLATGTNSMVVGQWYFIAIKVTISDAAGVVTLNMSGPGVNATEINIVAGDGVDTQNTANAYATRLSMTRLTAAGNIFLDNFHLYNGADGAPWDAISGERRIYFNLPDADGADVAWTPSAGNRFACVDENPPNGDTDYISEATATDKSSFTVPALAGITPDAVQAIMYARRDDAGPRGIKLYTDIGGTDYLGSEFLVGATYLYYAEQWVLSPDSGVAWGLAEVNAAEWGVQLST